MSPLIDAQELIQALVEGTPLCIVDCRFSLADTEQGRREFAQAHIPGAHYAHLDADLSGPIIPGQTGRHPLPAVESMLSRLAKWGISNDSSVVVYDDGPGAFASRLWWLLKYMGHRDVRVLDGGLRAYLAAGGRCEEGTNEQGSAAQSFEPATQAYDVQLQTRMVASLQEVERVSRAHSEAPQGSSARLFDARAADRFRGENETIDSRPGHIPGACSLPFAENIREGRFLSPALLRERFNAALAGTPPERAIFYCGSGVTACHNVLAAAVAGIDEVRLYPGSYSEWIADGTRPVAR